jgi:hypothetical protein
MVPAVPTQHTTKNTGFNAWIKWNEIFFRLFFKDPGLIPIPLNFPGI